MQLYEKYRPKTHDDFIGQGKVKRQLQAIMKRPGFDRDAFWIQGVSGTGKTSLAWIIARQLADDFEIQEIDGDDCNSRLLAITRNSFSINSGKRNDIVFVDGFNLGKTTASV